MALLAAGRPQRRGVGAVGGAAARDLAPPRQSPRRPPGAPAWARSRCSSSWARRRSTCSSAPAAPTLPGRPASRPARPTSSRSTSTASRSSAERGRPPMPEKPEEPYFYLGAVLTCRAPSSILKRPRGAAAGHDTICSRAPSLEPLAGVRDHESSVKRSAARAWLSSSSSTGTTSRTPPRWAPEWQQYFASWNDRPRRRRRPPKRRPKDRASRPAASSAGPGRPPRLRHGRPRRPCRAAAAAAAAEPPPAAWARTGSTS